MERGEEILFVENGDRRQKIEVEERQREIGIYLK